MNDNDVDLISTRRYMVNISISIFVSYKMPEYRPCDIELYCLTEMFKLRTYQIVGNS